MQNAAAKTVIVLKKHYAQKADMDLGNPEDSLIATILSARTTDAQVLKMFPAFRKKFPDWSKLAKADVETIARSISTIGLYRNKAKALKALGQKLLKDFDGKVPNDMKSLLSLPGVGRKTASCVLSYCFGVPSVAVDTHVFRITHRLGWAKAKDPEKVEEEIKKAVPKPLWSDVNRTMVHFGRDICIAGLKPKCWKCPVAKYCAYIPKTPKPLV